MKKIIFNSLSIPAFIMFSSIFFIFFNSCKDRQIDIKTVNKLNDSIEILNIKNNENYIANLKKDSVICSLQDSIVILNIKLDIENTKNKRLNDSLLLYKNKFYTEKLNTISYHNFSALYKLARIEKYVNICDKNPKNKVFFFGWIKRTIRQ